MRAKIIGLRSTRSGPGWADNWPALLFTNFVIGRSFFLILKCGCSARSVVLRQRLHTAGAHGGQAGNEMGEEDPRGTV